MSWEEYKYWFSYRYENMGCSGPMLAMMVLLLFLLCGCKSVQYIPVETVRTEYKVKTDTFIKKDSVLVKDSVFIHSKGDTVWFEKWHTKYKDRVVYQTQIDTLIKTDSIQVPYPVEKKLTKWQTFCLDYGKIMLGGTVAGIVIAMLWFIGWLRRKV